MKTSITALVLLAAATSAYAQAPDTLRHFDPQVNVPVADVFAGTDGYHTGHNAFGDEEFAEKYQVAGTRNVLGIVAIHRGVAGTSTHNASYRLYEVAGNGLPGTMKVDKSVPNNNIPVNGSPFVVLFNTPVSVTNTFFASFNLGDYSHSSPGTKMIALAHSPDGTRPASDLSVFGRNAIRWHSHGGAPEWYDYRTQNFTNYQPALHFALFPIMEATVTSVATLRGQAQISAAYPNPTSGAVTVPVTSQAGGKATFQLLDLQGKLISQEQAYLQPGQSHYRFTPGTAAAGTYILLIQIPEGGIAQKLTIN